MGTRNLTMVLLNNVIRVAQYGQWDGYPSGQGATALNFLQLVDLDKFKEQVSKTKFMNKEELKKYDEFCDKVNSMDDSCLSDQLYNTEYPFLSRNHGAEILEKIYETEKDIVLLVDAYKFGFNSSCEWAYLIDLDNNKFEVYSGYEENIPTTDRFYKEGSNTLKLIKTYEFKNLPTLEEFISDLEPIEEGNEEDEQF